MSIIILPATPPDNQRLQSQFRNAVPYVRGNRKLKLCWDINMRLWRSCRAGMLALRLWEQRRAGNVLCRCQHTWEKGLSIWKTIVTMYRGRSVCSLLFSSSVFKALSSVGIPLVDSKQFCNSARQCWVESMVLDCPLTYGDKLRRVSSTSLKFWTKQSSN